jgi:hypothetical protein
VRADMYVQAVLKKCELFSACSLWSREPQVRPRAWLNNFEETERPVAAVLLDHFVFFGAEATNYMLASTLRRLGAQVRESRGKDDLDRFTRNAVFTPVLGEDPNPTDSGALFCRKVRQVIGIPDTRFVSLGRAHELAAVGVPVIFLDDFIGSGDQMASTWERDVGAGRSFRGLASSSRVDATYLALVGTERGCRRLRDDHPELRLLVAHVLDQSHSVFGIPSNPLRPDVDDLPNRVDQLLQKYQSALQLPPYLSTRRERKYGYSELGLLLAFEHSVPDASLPLIWAGGPNGWTPLARRA